MPSESIEISLKPKRLQKAPARAVKPSTAGGARRLPKATSLPPVAAQPVVQRTKQETVLALLGHPDGATITDIMQTTGWQQHSVRGFLAGTVRKKLGLTLTSSKAEGDLRRYRIETRRGR